MDKRYQVFVSSTFHDLQEERQQVIQALLELDCIPAGMELFPAADDDQSTLIKKVIDDCDYFIVILAGRYGSLSESGVSYTQMEYEYALERGKPIISFLHRDPGSIAADKVEQNEEGKQKLAAFRSLLQKKKMCKGWSTASELRAEVTTSLIKLIKSKPAIGWVRADSLLDESTAEDVLSSRKRKAADDISNIARELSRIKESLSTHYIGRIKEYLPEVVKEIKKARKQVTILCDFPAYGFFTDHDDFDDYRLALKRKISDPNVAVNLMCLNKDCRAEANLKVFQLTEANWEDWKRNGGHNKLFRELGYSDEEINNLNLEEFLEALESIDRRMLNVDCKGAEVEEVDTSLTFDFWLFDDKRLIFALSTYAGDYSAYGFTTEDKNLISAFTEVRNRLYRQKVEDDIMKNTRQAVS